MIVRNPVTEETIRMLAREARWKIDRIYLHWTGGHYRQNEDAYHLCIDWDGSVYLNCKSFLNVKAHTLGRNSGAIGIALCCGYDGACWGAPGWDAGDLEEGYESGGVARPGCARIHYGPEPPTEIQVEVMARVVAILCDELLLPIDEAVVQTHCEVAFEDGYGPGSGDPDMRWDLWFLRERAGDSRLYPGGLLLRAKAQYYLDIMEEERYGDEPVFAERGGEF